MPPNRYEELDHTADLSIRVWAEDFHALLVQSVQGMYHLMKITPQDNTSVEMAFLIAKSASETQLVDFLSEMLFLLEEEGQFFEHFDFRDLDDGIKVIAKGSLVQRVEMLIKAVTFHDLNIREAEDGLTTVIVFDV